MKIKFTVLFSLIFPLVFAIAEETTFFKRNSLSEKINVNPIEDEIVLIEDLLRSTEKQLEIQKKLKILMIEFKKQKDLFIKGLQSKKHASLMVVTASKIMDLISSGHLQHLFSSEYLEELALFTSIANKHRPSSP